MTFSGLERRIREKRLKRKLKLNYHAVLLGSVFKIGGGNYFCLIFEELFLHFGKSFYLCSQHNPAFAQRTNRKIESKTDMKHSFFLLALLATWFAPSALAQTERVGINTRTPVSTLDVHATNSSTPLQYWRDNYSNILVSILSSGNVGIGTSTPTTKLEVKSTTKGALKIEDGTQGDGKILTSDANGVGTWQSAKTDIVLGTLGSGQNIPVSRAEWYYTNSYIDLPPGRWIIYVTMVLDCYNVPNRSFDIWLRSTFQDNTFSSTLQAGLGHRSSDIKTNAYLICGFIKANSRYGLVTGSVLVDNTSTAIKRYYYVAGYSDRFGDPFSPMDIPYFGGGFAGENIMYATRVN